MEGIQHKIVRENGINNHLAEKGEGSIILFLQTSSSFGTPRATRTMPSPLSATDLLGYRDSDTPVDVNSYTYFNVVGNIIGVLDAIGTNKVFMVGHDWGALIAWNLCLFRPDRVTCP